MGHQDFFGFDPEEARKRRDSLAAAVHVGGGNQQTNILTLMRKASGQAEIFAIGHQIDALGVGDALNKKGPRVMPGLFVFGAWISQANDQFNGSHDRGPSFGVVDNIAVGAAKVDDKRLLTVRGQLRILARFLATFRSAMFPQAPALQSELLCSAFFFSFWSNAWSVNVGNSFVITVSQCDKFNAFRGLEVGQVNDCADFQSRQVDFDELRQVFWQAGHFDFVQDVRDLAAFLDRSFFANEVHWNDSGQFLTGYNAYKVSVQHVAFGRVTLQCLDDYVLLFAANVQFDNVAVSSIVFEQFGDFFSQHADGFRGFFATVNYSWNQACETTQAAARTFPQVGTQFSIQSKIVHVVSPK